MQRQLRRCTANGREAEAEASTRRTIFLFSDAFQCVAPIHLDKPSQTREGSEVCFVKPRYHKTGSIVPQPKVYVVFHNYHHRPCGFLKFTKKDHAPTRTKGKPKEYCAASPS